MLTGDRKALAGALTNVLDNALHATDPGGRVCLSARPTPGRLSVNIADTGPGIPYAHQARVFEPFFSTRADGTGLGLAIARSVARAHGGDLTCRSTPGRGAEFVLTLPLDPAPCRRPGLVSGARR
jgi:two-component system sensor histidine kinase FlrB